MATCTGAIGATGMCLGGHLAYRAALDPRVKGTIAYFATDIHSHSLGAGMNDDSLQRTKEIKGELVMVSDLCRREKVALTKRLQIFGKKDTHIPPAGCDLIRKTLHDADISFSFYEIAHAQHAFIRDELSKGRYDPAIAGICFQMLLELFGRVLRSDLGASEAAGELEHVC